MGQRQRMTGGSRDHVFGEEMTRTHALWWPVATAWVLRATRTMPGVAVSAGRQTPAEPDSGLGVAGTRAEGQVGRDTPSDDC
jgi:hypothetical protein